MGKRMLAWLAALAVLLCGCEIAGGNSPSRESSAQTEWSSGETAQITTPLPSTGPDVTVVPMTQPLGEAELLLETMSLEELVGQIFLARCEAPTAVEDVENYHLGGFVLFGVDFDGQTRQTMKEKLAGYQAAARIPLLLAVDEEGGTVCRVSSRTAFRDSRLPSPRRAYEWGGMDGAMENEREKCRLLLGLGLNVNLGPVCDYTENRSAFVYQRSFGQSVELTCAFVTGAVNIMEEAGIGSALKHFPGYGDNADTHVGIVVDQRSLEELEEKDLRPFRAGMDAGCGAVMVSHTVISALDGELPGSLSPKVVGYLRETMGFDRVVLTDDLVMEAITDRYGAGEAAVMAVNAGCDLLCSSEYQEQYGAVLAAVEEGRIARTRLEEAALRVLQWKEDLGLLKAPVGEETMP